MTKYEVLTAFAQTKGFLTPDELRLRLRLSLDRRSVYSYLLRLARQGLLQRGRTWRGRLAYRLTERGRARLEYLKQQR
jgi:DNA-binding PadR family transcriptional regulator